MSIRNRRSDLLSPDEFAYIWVDIPGEEYQETLDAKILGNNLYQIWEVPFDSEAVNQYDIVECRDIDEVKHEFVRVVKPSGYQTIEIEFLDTEPKNKKWLRCMHELENRGADWGNVGKWFYISIPPTDEKKILDMLQEWAQQNIIRISEND